MNAPFDKFNPETTRWDTNNALALALCSQLAYQDAPAVAAQTQQWGFDPAKFEPALKRLYEAEAAARTTNIAANSAFVERLTDVERAAFLKSLNWPGVSGADKSVEEVPAPPKAP